MQTPSSQSQHPIQAPSPSNGLHSTQPYSLIVHCDASVFQVVCALVVFPKAWPGLSPSCLVLSCPLTQLPPSVMTHYHLPTQPQEIGRLPLLLSLLPLIVTYLPIATAPAAGAGLDGWPPMQICSDVMSHMMHRGAAALPSLLSYAVDGKHEPWKPAQAAFLMRLSPPKVPCVFPCLHRYLTATTSTEEALSGHSCPVLS
ncbi:hypothetical protein F5Y12DRAFT_582364 [Xylaria sp. FL1777]|nr:hypothetical protein F5Y12DRAFT_582364 [Xylaria sp. FL1777]